MYIVLSDDVTETMLVSQNKETVAMLVSQTSPEENEFLSYADAFFCSHKFAYMLATWVKTLYTPAYLNPTFLRQPVYFISSQ